MGSIPLLRPREVVKVFERLGWEIARLRGSHIILIKPGHLATPFHPRSSICRPGHLAQPPGQERSIFGRTFE
ncbi:MAG: type II toxin-antitoxin system HicA family toxin [Desulfobaccales bacterium]